MLGKFLYIAKKTLVEESTFRNISGHQTLNLPLLQRLLLFRGLYHGKYLHPTLTFICKSRHLCCHISNATQGKIAKPKVWMLSKQYHFLNYFIALGILFKVLRQFSFLRYLNFCTDFFAYVEKQLGKK